MEHYKWFIINANRSNIIPTPNLKDLIKNLLLNIMPPKYADHYVNPFNLKIWEKAFKSPTYDLTDNYEEEEYLGDRVLKVTYPIYLLDRNPEYTSKELSNIDMLVMEKKNQADMAFELGFSDFIKIPERNILPQIPTGILGDVLESFFGALDEIADVQLPGLGIIHTYNLLCYLFNQNTIPEKLKLGNVIMLVEQIFQQLGLTKLNEQKFMDDDDHVIIELRLDAEAIEFFNQHDIHVDLDILSFAKAKTKTAARQRAYEFAKKKLENIGVNQEFIEKIKKDRKAQLGFTRVRTKPLYTKSIKEMTANILKLVIKNKDMIDKLLTYTDVWNKVFTEDDVQLNYFGELMIKGLLAKVLFSLYKDDDYTKHDYNNMMSNLKNHYDLFIIDTDLTVNTIKPFLGALLLLSNKILMGSGWINCLNFIKVLFKKERIPYEFRFIHDKTALEQLLTPVMGKVMAKPNVTETFMDGQYDFIISLTPKQIEFFNKNGFNIKDPILSQHAGPYKMDAQRRAYQEALAILADMGVTPEWVATYRREREFKRPEFSIYKDKLESLKQREEFDYLYFAMSAKTSTPELYLVQFVGVKGKEKIVVSSLWVSADTDKNKAKIELLKKYFEI